MKNLNKKIGAVALAAMMLVGGVAANVRVVQADSGSIQGISKIPNLQDYKFVNDLCNGLGISILESDIDNRVIDSYIDKHLNNSKNLKRDKDLVKKLRDIEIKLERDEKEKLGLYLESIKKSSRKIHRFKFGHNEYLVLVK